jgi:MYXO-CTERM domain-containing protein
LENWAVKSGLIGLAALAGTWAIAAGPAEAVTYYETADPAETTVDILLNYYHLDTFFGLDVTYQLPAPVVLHGYDWLEVDVPFAQPILAVVPSGFGFGSSSGEVYQSFDAEGRLNGVLTEFDAVDFTEMPFGASNDIFTITGLTTDFYPSVYNPGDLPTFSLSGAQAAGIEAPEASAWVLMLLGVGLIGAARRRRWVGV